MVVVAVAAYVVIQNDDEGTDNRNYDGRLMVFGNANNDDYIDDNDLETLREIIDSGTWDRNSNPYADANNDGTVDSDDISFVERMINRDSMEIWYVNAASEVKSINYPIGNIVVIGSDAMRGMQILDLKDKVVGRSGSSQPDLYLDPLLNSTIVTNAMELSQSTSQIDLGLLSNLLDTTTVDVVVTGRTTLSDVQSQLEDGLGIHVVRMAFNDDVSGISSFLTMGYLANKEVQAHAVAEYFDDTISYIESVLASIPEEDRVTAIPMAGGGALYSAENTTSYGSWTMRAGAINPISSSMLDGALSKTVNRGDTWHLGTVYDADYVVYMQGFNYSYDAETFADNYWNSYVERFSWDRMTASNYPDSVVLLNWNLYEPLARAYLCAIFYPEEFGEDYGDRVHQGFIDRFYSDLSAINYQASDYGFAVTYDDVKDYL